MTEKFIAPDAKIEMMSDEELDLVAGGSATMYYSQPYVNDQGTLMVSTVTVSGKMTYDPLSRSVQGIMDQGSGFSGALPVPYAKFSAYKERVAKRGTTLVGLDISGPLVL
ncbi:hypothetical protein [uncultured Phascolarctobacterium sp.]|uniref:hypothetical protein n=1 Tax=uncultured Phascolarctobacterium sp. TaxID=512296 RepID=UPI002600D1BE|nr:hypothetical protein [uncultured Phascolarctobacterium sp.]